MDTQLFQIACESPDIMHAQHSRVSQADHWENTEKWSQDHHG